MNHDGYFLKNRRRQLDMTLQEVADRAGINIKQYQRFEAGDRELDNAGFTTVVKVLKALDIDVGKYAAGEYAIKELIYRGHDGRLYNFDTDELVDAYFVGDETD